MSKPILWKGQNNKCSKVLRRAQLIFLSQDFDSIILTLLPPLLIQKSLYYILFSILPHHPPLTPLLNFLEYFHICIDLPPHQKCRFFISGYWVLINSFNKFKILKFNIKILNTCTKIPDLLSYLYIQTGLIPHPIWWSKVLFVSFFSIFCSVIFVSSQSLGSCCKINIIKHSISGNKKRIKCKSLPKNYPKISGFW